MPVLFSIILPIYNVENYLEDCLESILKQEELYEVICVNDASTDNSCDILERYQKENSNIVIINHEINRGLSAARNSGLKIAKGRYVVFVDSDDYLNENALSILAEYIYLKEQDIICFNYDTRIENDFYKEKSLNNTYRNKQKRYFSSGKKWFSENVFENNLEVTAWSKVYRREFLISNELCFYEGIVHEDILFCAQCSVKANSILEIVESCYTYRRREQSITSAYSVSRLDSLVINYTQLMRMKYQSNIQNSDVCRAIDIYCKRNLMGAILPMLYYFPSHKQMSIGTVTDQIVFETMITQSYMNNRYIRVSDSDLIRVFNAAKVLIYGAGRVAIEVVRLLDALNITISGIVVKNANINPEFLMNYKIRQIDQIDVEQEVLIIVAVLKKSQAEITKDLKKLGYNNILLIDAERRYM